MTGPREQQAALYEQEELTELRGHIESIRFTNPENGFTVAKLQVKGNRSQVTLVGNLLEPVPGQVIVARGRWRTDPRYGEQFQAKTCEVALPHTVTGIRNYLQSGLIKGVGASFADKIVSYFGEETLDVLDNDPDRLLEVDGVGEMRLAQIKKAWEEHRDIRDLMLFLQSHAVSSAYAVRIFKFYGCDALRVVKENPYRMAMDIPGVGFITADSIAFKLGFPRDCDLRAEAGAFYTLHQMSESGHLFVPYDLLVDKACEMLDLETGPVEQGVASLEKDGRVVVEDLDCNWDRGCRAVYLAAYHTAETGAAQMAAALLASPKKARPMDPEKAIAWVEKKERLHLAPLQAEAVRKAATSKVLVITGGPGTGKTTIIRAVLRIYDSQGEDVLLAAPTGRAAKRMAEATGREAMTIHRLLEYSPQNGKFQRNLDNTLKCSLLIVDEASMIDIVLMYHLLKAIPSGATLILAGDVNQLPSVGPGQVLGDIIKSGVVPVVELKDIFRQARESAIVVNAHAINHGKIPSLDPPEEGLSDFYFVRREDPDQVLDMILELAAKRIPQRFGFDPVEDVQVLTPMHKGTVGAANLNQALQQTLNPPSPAKAELRRGERVFRVGDKVMQIKNNYDKEIFNGDLGRVAAVDVKNRFLTVLFDGREICVSYDELDEIAPAYAVTIHKSQGSEYSAVIIPVLTQHYIMLQRNLVYTAVTRGKQLVVLVGTPKALAIAVRNDSMQHRHTWLAQRLSDAVGR